MWEGMQGPVNVAPYSTLGCLNSIETSDRKHAGKPCTIQQTATYCDDYYNYIISEKGKRVCMSVRRRITSVQENARAAHVCYILTCNVCAVFDVVCKHVLVLGYCRGERVVLRGLPFPLSLPSSPAVLYQRFPFCHSLWMQYAQKTFVVLLA